ncbi:MAG: hypothetical protein Q4F27_01305 [Desulfovibrionaceae bacterium]|nr:hypothetical protein [Desulfovibrionaceae bacterium]
MQGNSYFLILALAAVCLLILVFFLRKSLQKSKLEKRRQAVVCQTLVTAQEQNELFDVKFLNADANMPSLAGTLLEVRGDKLSMEVLSLLPDMDTYNVEVYFHVVQPTGSIFYKFNSCLRSVRRLDDRSHVVLDAPSSLEVGQRRSFMRIKPPTAVVRALGVWSMEGRTVPHTTRDAGPPLIFYKTGMENKPVQIENISATGIALRFAMPDPEQPPLNVVQGTQLLCLVVYALPVPEGEKLITFWSTCHVVNIRTPKEEPPSLVLGMEFTNWAMLEGGKAEIHWFHASPTRGVAPIIQWVMQMDLAQRR